MASVKPDTYVRLADMTDEAYKKIQNNQELNAQALQGLLIAQIDKSCFQVVWNCKTSEYKKGSARLAWEALCTIKQPDESDSSDVEEPVPYVQDERNTDPNQWITSLESIHSHIIAQGNDILELDFNEHITGNLGLDYAQEAK